MGSATKRAQSKIFAATRVGIVAIAGSTGAMGMSGCTMDATDEPLGVENELLGEIGCVTLPCGNNCQGLNVDPGGTGSCAPPQYFFYTSPPVPYGTADCPNAYAVRPVVEGSGVTFYPYIAWADTPLTSSDCVHGKLDMAVYTRPNASSSSWTTTTYRWHGEWNAGSNYCAFVLNSGYTNPTQFVSTGFNEIIVAGTAKVFSTGYRLVNVGARNGGHGPC